MTKMQNEINTFVKENGNVKYTIKELMQALHTKFDEHEQMNHESHQQIRDRLTKEERVCAEIQGILQTRALIFKFGMPVVISSLAGLLVLILTLQGVL